MDIPLVDLKANYLSIKNEIDQTIQQVIDETAFIKGKHLEEFEKNYADFCNTKHAIGASSGTTALHLALESTELQQNDEIITVSNTFIATTECISQNGGKIKFVDVEPNTGLIDIDELEKNITPQTKAIVVVHLYGQMPNMERIKKIADQHNLILIEDAAQAHYAEWNHHQPGYYGDIASFSFYPAKNLGCYGDGGAIVTNDDKIAKKAQLLVDHGRKEKYEHQIEGYNYRLDALQAAILNTKLPHLPRWTKLRRQHAKFYDENLPEGIMTPEEAKQAKHVYYMYEIRTKKRNQLKKYLKKQGIHCGIHYPIPLHLQPAYKKLGYKKGSLPVTEKISQEILSLPMYPELTVEQLDYIVENIKKFFKK
ncbi:MAG: DegT/DnrJ/EryC1/StrS family aminotransferase [Candidatus Thermoplasmatota archaeon]